MGYINLFKYIKIILTINDIDKLYILIYNFSLKKGDYYVI